MANNTLNRQDSIARELGWESYDAAPGQVQRNIDAKIEGPFIADPFVPLTRGGDGG